MDQNLIHPTGFCISFYSLSSSCNSKLTGRLNCIRTGLPRWVPGFHFGILFTTRITGKTSPIYCATVHPLQSTANANNTISFFHISHCLNTFAKIHFLEEYKPCIAKIFGTKRWSITNKCVPLQNISTKKQY